MRLVDRTIGSLLLLLSVATALAADAPSERLAASSPRGTPAGHTFIAPEGFTLKRLDHAVVLQPPETDSTIAFVDVDAANADDAVAQGWKAIRPAFDRKLKLATARPARNGWQDVRVYDYETSPNEKAVVYAVARRSTVGDGKAWVAILVDATDATMEKRGAPVSQMFASLRPAGYVRENLAGRTPHPLDAERIAVLKRFVADGMKELNVPGVGLSFIDGSRVVYEGGLGVKTLGRADPVDAHTLFIAASNTKAMTSLLLAQAVDAGKLRWDEPVQEAYPAFTLGDPAVAKQVLVRHLVCACTGIPRQDLDWLFQFRRKTAASTFDTLGQMKPTSGFGEVFQYSNLMVGAGGYVAASVLAPGVEPGAAYDRLMHDRIFAPLGMNDTTFDFARAQNANHASPHAETIDGETKVGPMDLNYAILSARPAGGLWTSPHDFSRFVLMELAKGRSVDGKAIVSEQNLMERRKPQIVVSEDVNYGMGLMVDRQLGIEIVHHGGDLSGYHSDMIWLPDYGIGATILTNSDAGYLLRGPLLRKLLEVVFDAKPEADEQLKVAAANRIANIRKDREKLVLPADPVAVSQLARSYVNPVLGKLIVVRRGKQVRFDFGDWRSDVASRRNDDGTLTFMTSDPGLAGFEFVVATQDGKRSLVLRDAQHEYAFVETR